VIEVKGVHLRAGKLRLLADFNWRLPDSGNYLLLGPTASGKSVLARTLTGRWRPQRGQVLIDGAPVYGLLGGHAGPLFLAQAEVRPQAAEPLDIYLGAELAATGESPSALDGIWPLLEEMLPAGRRTPTDQLSHGQLLLAQVALACAAPVRLAVLDGHLTLLDRDYCSQAAKLLAGVRDAHDKFVVLTASRLADPLPELQGRFVLAGGTPVSITELSGSTAVDTAVRPASEEGALRVYAAPATLELAMLTSGRHFSLLARLEDGLRIRLAGGLEPALAELRELGIDIRRVEWED
jgi:ABC-type cobalamin/Fe3+-siderophores transport system ATPase subunit